MKNQFYKGSANNGKLNKDLQSVNQNLNLYDYGTIFAKHEKSKSAQPTAASPIERETSSKHDYQNLSKSSQGEQSMTMLQPLIKNNDSKQHFIQVNLAGKNDNKKKGYKN